MIRTILVNAALLLGLASASVGCSRAQVICDIICECEHCSDESEIQTCEQLATQENVADAYDCGDAWVTYTTCVEEQGTCNETDARYTTEKDNNDVCNDERDALNSCIDAASAHGGARF
ncbi:hypothetical protein [Polyangium fumosum]|uniref:Uncharacterized protein n=1 Tax=Polyangium fumosum TaxID=889272 RepID=A0A4U1IP23_9BACT|nr:hypothetical protein [Polyangium fumosum]TKC95875.1 hypothetical protein E8A74_46100 [Polyangium fumosum]